MQTAKTIADTGAAWPTAGYIAKAKVEPCPARGPLKESEGGASAQCGMVAERHGKPHAVSESLCKICQYNGGPDFDNPLLKCLVCHLAWNDVVAGVNATAPLSPTDGEIDIALSIVCEYRNTEVARGFIEALVWHESITQEKATELLRTITERAGND